MDREQIMERVIGAVEAYDLTARGWTGGDHVRIYVTRTLSRGRRQDIGYIEIESDGSRDYCLSRNSAGIRDHVEASMTREEE